MTLRSPLRSRRAAIQRGKPAVIDVVIDADQDMRKEVYSPLAKEALAGTVKRSA